MRRRQPPKRKRSSHSNADLKIDKRSKTKIPKNKRRPPPQHDERRWDQETCVQARNRKLLVLFVVADHRDALMSVRSEITQTNERFGARVDNLEPFLRRC